MNKNKSLVPTKSRPTLTKPQLMTAAHVNTPTVTGGTTSIGTTTANTRPCLPLSNTSSPSITTTNTTTKRTPTPLITLTPAEEQLFHTLTSAAVQYEKSQSPPLTSPIQIRVAGGWVRDKILNLYSHDVDVAIDCMSGVDFATIVKRELDKIEPPQKHKMGVISANPDQSKHLETATMKIHGIEVDFVHLRGEEVYEKHSRIPSQVKDFGSPLEDALRRDFTINSLFYNVREKCVEDFTERGLDDLLVRRLIETPLCPHVTFHDDPLRVLRAIRFGVRYEFGLADDLRAAAMSTDVKESLIIKVSRERVGKELEGMLTGKGAKPLVALGLIVDLGLGDSIFCHPQGMTITGRLLGEEERKEEEIDFLKGWRDTQKYLKPVPEVLKAVGDVKLDMESNSENGVMMTESEVDVRMLHLSCLLLPFVNLKYIDRKKKIVLVVEWMLKEGVKFKNKDIYAIRTLTETLPSMTALLTRARDDLNGDKNSFSRLETGLLLRQLKHLWVTSLLQSTIAEMAIHPASASDTLRACLKLYVNVFEHKLDGCWKTRPLLDGKELIKVFNLPRGPAVGKFLNEQVRWMLLNPDGSRDECEKYLRQVNSEKEEENLSVEGGAKS